mmetsp:Transcript_49365/g.127374  ORF Transcript_49365/g.127374 Transcript_49365/m.127374 type:complete len:212 (+) Transcript_49365:1041-1676(+)
MPLELLGDVQLDILRVEAFGLDEQLASWHTPEHLRPQSHNGRVDLGQATKRAEGHCAVARRRQRAHFWHVSRGRVAQEAPGQAHQLLREPLLGVHRVHCRIRDSVVDGTQPSGVVVAYVRKLHRRRLQRCNVKPVVRGMAGKVDKDVDLILLDHCRSLVRRLADNGCPTPRAHKLSEKLRLVVLTGAVGVNVHFEELSVVVSQKRMCEKRY